MKHTFFVLFCCVMLWSCKNNTDKKTVLNHEVTRPKVDSLQQIEKKHDSIRLLLSFSNSFNSEIDEMKSLMTNIEPNYIESIYFKNKINSNFKLPLQGTYSKKIARDFKNKNFESIKGRVFTETTPKERNSNIVIEAWYFENEAIATSCFKSLTTYEEHEIYFKVIHWIWVQQKNKLFFIHSTYHDVNAKPMQIIKNHLIDILKEKGEFKTIEIDY